MAVNRANSLLMNQGMPSQHIAIHYEPRSDFINLTGFETTTVHMGDLSQEE